MDSEIVLFGKKRLFTTKYVQGFEKDIFMVNNVPMRIIFDYNNSFDNYFEFNETDINNLINIYNLIITHDKSINDYITFKLIFLDKVLKLKYCNSNSCTDSKEELRKYYKSNINTQSLTNTSIEDLKSKYQHGGNTLNPVPYGK